MIHIGTSGYSYNDWKGFFYPETLSSKDFLKFYSSHFNALELNFSYYKMPTAKQLEKMVSQTDGKMLFAIKAHQCFTHHRTASQSDFHDFVDALKPMVNANCLGAILLQFPHSFHQNELNRQYLSRLAAKFELPLVAEFRNVDWASAAIYQWLKKINVGFCCVDEPQLPGLMPAAKVTTSQTAYIRFHGRNATKWYNHNHGFERYDYRYNQHELGEWLADIQTLDRRSDNTLVFFNNHFQAKAVDGAKKLSNMLLSLRTD